MKHQYLQKPITELNSNLKSSFQAGVDTLYNKCVNCGSTPSSKTPTAISNSIQSIYTNRYNSGYSSGQSSNSGNTIKGKSIAIHCYHACHQIIATFGCNIKMKFLSGNAWVNIMGYSQDYTSIITKVSEYTTLIKNATLLYEGITNAGRLEVGVEKTFSCSSYGCLVLNVNHYAQSGVTDFIARITYL